MIVQLHHPASPEVIQEAEAFLSSLRLQSRLVQTVDSTMFVVYSGDLPDPRRIRQCPGVRDVHRISDDFKLVSSQWKQGRSTVTAGEVDFGPRDFQWIMGPCSVEGEDQLESVAAFLSSQGVRMMRGACSNREAALTRFAAWDSRG